MFGWLFKRKRRGLTSADVDQQLGALRLQREHLKMALIESMARNPQTMPYAAGALLPSVAKMLGTAQPAQDQYQAFVFRLLEKQGERSGAREFMELLALLKSAKTDLADLIDDRDVEPPESDNVAVQLLSTPAAVRAVELFAPVAATFAAAQAQARAAAALPQTTITTVSTPAPMQPPEVDPAQVLQVLQSEQPQAAAQTAIVWAQRSPALADVLRQLLSLPEASVPVALQLHQANPAWGPVAQWLLQHEDYRIAFLAALRDLASAPYTPTPTPASTNGHGGL